MTSNPTVTSRYTGANGHRKVKKLPRVADSSRAYWIASANGGQGLTHQLFRYPAKFHPPVVRWALGKYGRRGFPVLDPFTGSGTAQLEAFVRGIPSVGVDVDPLACLVARTKCTPIDPDKLLGSFNHLRKQLARHSSERANLYGKPGTDISEATFTRERGNLDLPSIPNIQHWFRRYVIVDLARVLTAIDEAGLGAVQSRFFRVCFASIVRRVSNADPVPVSGLEVTAVQKKRNAKRKIDVYQEFTRKCEAAIQAMRSLWEICGPGQRRTTATILNGSVLSLRELLRERGSFGLIVTSPPYCQAVDYNRRHRLESWWLRLIDDNERGKLTHSYIGRHVVRTFDAAGSEDNITHKPLSRLLNRIEFIDLHRARALRTYFQSMSRSFAEIASVLKPRGTFVCVIGDSHCCGVPVPTSDLVAGIAAEHLELRDRFSYVVRNHYMQYHLRNGHGIKRESVLVFKR